MSWPFNHVGDSPYWHRQRRGPVIAVVGGAALSGGLSFATGATIGSLTALQTAFVVAGANAALGLATTALTPKPKVPDFPDFKTEIQENRTLARVTNEDRQLIFGEAQVSGPLNLFESTGSDKEYLQVIVPHGAHPCHSFVRWWLNNEEIGTRDGSGSVTDGRFSGHVRINGHLGGFDQAADGDLVSEITNWTSSHQGGGVPYTAARLKHSTKVWPNGFSTLKALVRGMPCYDPRDTGVAISSSTAASPAVFTTATAHGFSVGDHIWVRDHAGGAQADGTGVDKWCEVATVPTSTTFTLLDQDGAAIALSTGGTGGTATRMNWTNNWALCVRMFLTHRWGFGASDDEIVDTMVIASANVCDEQVALTPEPQTFTVDATTDVLTLSGKKTWKLGDVVRFTTTDTLPSPLAVDTDYYLDRDGAGGDTYKIATSLENARAGVFVDIVDAGTGDHTATRNSQLRYTCNGTVKLGREPLESLEDMMTAAAGIVAYDGRFLVMAGSATSVTGEITESDFTDKDIEVIPRLSRDSIFNRAQGTFRDPDQFYTDVGAPVYQSATARADDGGEVLTGDFELKFTNDPTLANRLLKINVERARQGATLEATLKPRKYTAAITDVEGVTIDDFGFSSKDMRFMRIKENQDFSLSVSMREEASSVWDWNLGEETTIDPAPNSNLPSAFDVAAPTGWSSASLESGTSHLFTKADGTVVSRVKVSWTAPADLFVKDGGAIEVHWKKTADSDFDVKRVPGAQEFAYLDPVQDGVSYDVYLVAVNSAGGESDATSTESHTVIGKTAPPSDVASLSAQQNGSVVVFKWPAITDADRAGYAVKYAPRGSFVWADATPISEELIARGTTITTALIPPGDWTFGIKAQDTSENQSTNSATVNLVVANTNDVVLTSEAAPVWSGTLTNLEKHWTGVLVPSSTKAANLHTNAELFEQYVPYPESICTYETAAFDLGFDADAVRVYSDIQSVLGPGESSGNADPAFAIDYRDDAGSFDGYENWTVGTVDFRHIKGKLSVDTSKGKPVVTGFELVCDVTERTERGEDVVVASPGPQSIAFAQPFHSKPNVQVSVDGSSALIPVKGSVTTTGFDVYVFNSGGTDVGGTVDWEATGA